MRRAQDRARSATFKNSGARSATIESRALGALKLASDENVPVKRADFFFLSLKLEKIIFLTLTTLLRNHILARHGFLRRPQR